MCTASGVEIKPVTKMSEALSMAMIRNECREWMTRNTERIGPLSQLRWWRKVRSDPHWMLYLMWINGTPIGYGIIRYADHKHWVTGGIVTSARGHGHGRKLFARLTEIATDGSYAYLEVKKDNRRAVELYRSLGYRYLGEPRPGVLLMRAAPA